MQNNITTEEWRDIPAYKGVYQISSLGGVRRILSRYGHPTSRIMKPSLSTSGYFRVVIEHAGLRKSIEIHRLLALAFLEPMSEPGMMVNHIDGVRTNNALSNLEWVTAQGNTRHALNAGRLVSKRKLAEDQVRSIRASTGIPLATLAAQFGVSVSQIAAVRARRYWRHID